MPATAADIAAATREAVAATWSDGAIRTRYPRARDDSGQDAPGGNCDAIADAQVLVNARGALLGVERRRFAVVVQDVLWSLAAPESGTVPTVTLIDVEHAVNGPALVTRIEIDLNSETTSLELWV